MDMFLVLYPLVGMTILTLINVYIAYITFHVLKISIALLEETVVIKKETILVRQISKTIEEQIWIQ